MRSIREIRRTGARTPAELKRFWKDRDKAMREGDKRGTKAYMDRMDAPTPRKNPTKAQKRPNKLQRLLASTKRAKAKRMSEALKKYLKIQNPGTEFAGAAIQQLKGGVLKITPIKAVKRGRR